MTSIQPELWVDRGAEAVAFYQAAFGATVLHRVGDGEDIVAQLAIGDAAFWVSTAGSAGQRIHPKAIGGATSRTLLIVDDPEAVFHHAVTAGATPPPPADEHGWRACPDHRPIRPSMGNRAPPRHLAATPTLTTTGKPAHASAGSRSQRAQITRFSAHRRWRRERLDRRADRRLRVIPSTLIVTDAGPGTGMASAAVTIDAVHGAQASAA